MARQTDERKHTQALKDINYKAIKAYYDAPEKARFALQEIADLVRTALQDIK